MALVETFRRSLKRPNWRPSARWKWHGMTHLSKRLNRLEAQRDGDAVAGSSIIFIGEVIVARFVGGACASRNEGETEPAFIA